VRCGRRCDREDEPKHLYEVELVATT